MDSGHIAMDMAFWKDVEWGHPGKENIPTLVTPWGISKATEQGFWMSRFQPCLSPLIQLFGLEACNPCILRLMWDHSALRFSWFLSVNNLTMCKHSCILKVPEKIFPFVLPAHHHKFKKQPWQNVPRIPAKCSLLWGKEAMQSTRGNVIKPERKQKWSNSALTFKYVNYVTLQASSPWSDIILQENL